jgi:RHS repeat-associated protein
LASVTSSVSAYNYTQYDALGRVTQYNQQTASQLYTMSASYNKGGLMLSETYPSGKVIETQFDGAGRIAGVKKQSATGYIAGAASSDATNRLQYTAHGAASAMKLGNSLWEHTNFNSRLQPTQIGLGTTSATSGTLQLDYGYGTTTNNGNVMSQLITIQVPNQNSTTFSQSYTYDQVNRLLSASEGANWNQQYGYDVYGNRWVQPSSTYIPNPSLTPQSQSAFSAANNRIALTGFNYDAVGNLTSDPTTAINGMVYDAENRQTSYTKAGVTTQYRYDGDGRRVTKIDSTGTTVFVYNAAGQLVAEYTDAGTSGTVTMSYLTSDHLGSTRVVTDGTGAVKARHDYLPFGEEIGSNIGGRDGVTGYVSSDSTRQKFTGKERDGESGLDYFGARYLSSAQGRFTSVDPIMIKIDRVFDPQRLNLYAYVRNNPLLFTDPNGKDLIPGSGDQKAIRKALAEIAKRPGGREFLQKLDKLTLQIALSTGEVKGPSGNKEFGTTKGSFNATKDSQGNVVDAKNGAAGGLVVIIDPKLADESRKENKKREEGNEAMRSLGLPGEPRKLIPDVPASDAQQLGHELVHDEFSIFGNGNTNDESAVTGRINSILAEPVDKNLAKTADAFVDNLLQPNQPKPEEKKKPQ